MFGHSHLQQWALQVLSFTCDRYPKRTAGTSEKWNWTGIHWWILLPDRPWFFFNEVSHFAGPKLLVFLDPKGRKPSPREREPLAWTARVDGSLREPHGIPNSPGSATSMWVSLKECLWIRRRRPGWLNGLVMPCPKLSQIGCLSEAGKMINRWSTHRTISEPNVLGSSLTLHWAFLNHIHICVYTYAHSMDTISTYIYIYACVHTHRHNSVGMELWVDPLQVRNFPARHAIQTRTASGSPKLLCPSNRCFSIPKIRKSLGFGFCSMACFKTLQNHTSFRIDLPFPVALDIANLLGKSPHHWFISGFTFQQDGMEKLWPGLACRASSGSRTGGRGKEKRWASSKGIELNYNIISIY